jgi:hypothetical protein
MFRDHGKCLRQSVLVHAPELPGLYSVVFGRASGTQSLPLATTTRCRYHRNLGKRLGEQVQRMLKA